MKIFDDVTRQVRFYLSENHYCHSLIKANERCFRSLEAYLKEKGVDYSPEIAKKWLEDPDYYASSTDRPHWKMALVRLKDIYEHGEILTEHDTRHLMSYTILCEGLKNSLDSYLESLKGRFSEETIDGHKHPCARFLIYIQKNGIYTITDITFETICQFYQTDMHRGHFEKSHTNAAVSSMMAYFWSEGLVPYGFTIIIHYLSHGKRNQGCYWNDVPTSVHESIAEFMKSSPTVSTDRLREYRDYSMQLHHENGYSKSVSSAHKRAIDLLILFLEMNGHRYNPEIAIVWFNSICHYFGKEQDTMYRSLCMVAEYHSASCIDLVTVHRRKPGAFYLIPEWCKEAAVKYVESKKKEGWARSTMDMIRSSITRFCNYLDSVGVRSFMELTVAHIKQFNVNDRHKTPYGKNAYNTRIRKFLIYLGENGYVLNPMLFVSLTCTSAPTINHDPWEGAKNEICNAKRKMRKTPEGLCAPLS